MADRKDCTVFAFAIRFPSLKILKELSAFIFCFFAIFRFSFFDFRFFGKNIFLRVRSRRATSRTLNADTDLRRLYFGVVDMLSF
jgi:hypothetical protein